MLVVCGLQVSLSSLASSQIQTCQGQPTSCPRAQLPAPKPRARAGQSRAARSKTGLRAHRMMTMARQRRSQASHYPLPYSYSSTCHRPRVRIAAKECVSLLLHACTLLLGP